MIKINDKKVDLKVTLPGLGEMKNPIIPASGTFGFAYEFAQFYDLNILGSISLKGTTLEPRFGNALPRIAETPNGMLNAIGLQNPGIDAVLQEELAKLRPLYQGKILLNVSGNTLDDYLNIVKKIEVVKDPLVGALEINVSCPNVHNGGMLFGVNPEIVEKLTREIKKITSLPIFLKLTPNVTSIAVVAQAAETGGADGLSLINTLLGMRLEAKTGRPILANKMGGFSGPAILPVAVRCVYQAAQAVKIPLIGIGGAMKAADVIELMSAGATAVQIGTANLVDPWASQKIINDLPKELIKIGETKIKNIIGRALKF